MLTDVFIIGPFLAGPREPMVDFLYPESKSYYSVYSGKPLKWRKLKVYKDSLIVSYDTTAINDLIEYQGYAGALAVYYIKGKLKVKKEGTYLMRFSGVFSISINGKRYIMDIYDDGYFVPVYLKKSNEIFIAVGTLGGEKKIKWEIKPAPSKPFILEKDITKPDFITGESFIGFIGVPIVNPTPRGTYVNINNRRFYIEGFQVLKVPVMVSFKAPKGKGKVVIPISFMKRIYKIKIDVKTPDEVIRRTFISKTDSSVQYYAVRYPKNYNPLRKYSLILSLHGAGVEAVNQCKSYKPKDWAFVVCPTNRRRFGFDWEDWGRIDALEVLEEVLKNYNIDRNSIYLTGHSMGGHGVWHLCTSYPSIWKGCLPMAGWTSVKLYISTHLQRSRLFPENEFTALRERIFQQSEPYKLVENLKNLPIVILQGSDDDVVPPFHGRLMSDLLHRYGANFKYIEEPGKKHWWKGVLDHKKAWKYLRSMKVKRKFKVFSTFSLDVSDSAFGVRILESFKPFEKSGFVLERKRSALKISTKNIKSLVLPRYKGKIVVDGEVFKRYDGEVLVRTRRGWRKFKKYIYSRPVLIREGFMEPFMIVYSTNENWTNNFAVYMANMWWMYANGFARVIPDTLLTEDILSKYNIVIIGSDPKLPMSIKSVFEKVGRNSIDILKGPFDRFLVFYKISDRKLVKLGMSLVPYITRSVAVLPTYILLSEKAYVEGWSGLSGGIRKVSYSYGF